MLWYVVYPIFITLIFGGLAVGLFRLGISIGIQNEDEAFPMRIAKGWVTGWLLVIALMIAWLSLLLFLYRGYEYVGSTEPVYYMLIGGIAIVLIYPGIEIALRMLSIKPSLERVSIVRVALGWTIPFAIYLIAAFWVWVVHYFEVRKLVKAIGLNLSLAHYLGLTAVATVVGIAVSSFVGIKVMQIYGKIPDIPIDGDGRNVLDRRPRSGSQKMREKVRDMGAFFGSAGLILNSKTKAKFGWIISWVLFLWLAAEQFGVYSVSTVERRQYVLRFVLITALTISSSGGLIAGVILRDPSESWKTTIKKAKNWALNGLLGWCVGAPLGWGVVKLYQQFIVLLLRNRAIELANKIDLSQQYEFLIVGLFALFLAAIFVQKNPIR